MQALWLEYCLPMEIKISLLAIQNLIVPNTVHHEQDTVISQQQKETPWGK